MFPPPNEVFRRRPSIYYRYYFLGYFYYYFCFFFFQTKAVDANILENFKYGIRLYAFIFSYNYAPYDVTYGG